MATDLKPGDRVYHNYQQWPGAWQGTATVLEAKPQHDGTVEYLVQSDKPIVPGGSNEPSWWPSYYTYKAER